MHPKLIITEDQSPTLYSDTFGQTYHSHHGAEQESLIVFIQNGWTSLVQKPDQRPECIHILECGLGSGLNAALTWRQAEAEKIPCSYIGMEKFPPSIETLRAFAEHSSLPKKLEQIAQAPWDKRNCFGEYFNLIKLQQDFSLMPPKDLIPSNGFDLIYYDAFSPEAQPELWTPEQISRICSLLRPGGIFCTYCSKGSVKEALRASGMIVKRLPGPPGKRHVLQAFATSSGAQNTSE